MRKRILNALVAAGIMTVMFVQTAFAAGADITSYAFADIAGNVGTNSVTVNVPYSTVTTYWNHRVQVSPGATFTTSSLTEIDDQHYRGIITVFGDDGTQKEYTININKNNFVGPEYEVGKAKSIRKNSAKIPVKLVANDAKIRNVRLVYYTKKNSTMSKTLSQTDFDEDVELTGLSDDTKYYYYIEVDTDEKTYTSSSRSFTTKEDTSTGSSSSSTNNSSSTNKQPSSGTNATGPGTPAKENTQKKNEWSLENGKWYYYGEDGFTKVGWFQVGDKWYYVQSGTNDLKMSEWAKINGVWYYFDASGAMLANNWIYSSDKWYWLGPSGTMLTSQEIDVNGKHYLLNPDGTVADNVMVIKNGRYMYYKAGAQGLAINEAFEYNGQTLHADQYGYVY